MSDTCRLSIVSDIHYSGPAERARAHELHTGIENPLMRMMIRAYRHYIWLRDPFAHNHLLDEFLQRSTSPDYVVANGDYSCDTAYVGVSDHAAYESASECLQKLRSCFGPKLLSSYGDHELGKKRMGSNRGGLRLESWDRACHGLKLEPLWQVDVGNYLLVGVVSTLLALPVYAPEGLPPELPEWNELRRQHIAAIERIFTQLKPDQKVLLFCHDPTALPFLYRLPAVQDKLRQIERTIIGHLHSNLVFRQARLLSGMPHIRWGHTVQRMSAALREARYWHPFHVLLCPSLSGIELLKDGGFYTAELDLHARHPARFRFHPLPR